MYSTGLGSFGLRLTRVTSNVFPKVHGPGPGAFNDETTHSVAVSESTHTGQSVDADAVELTVDGADLRIPFAAIHKAKLVLTDALIALHQASEDNNEQEEA